MSALYNFKPALTLPVSDTFVAKVEEWCANLYTDQFKNVHRWEDQFVNENLDARVAGDKEIVLTRYGLNNPNGFADGSNLASSFWCITGPGLYDYMPWYQPMEDFLLAEGLTSHLSFPCILVANGYVRKHTDVGRKTVINYDLFGSNNLVWGISYEDTYDIDQLTIPGSEHYDEIYDYDADHCVLMDVSRFHGGYLKDGIISTPRAAINHGFLETFNVCKSKFEEMDSNGKLAELQLLLNSNT